MDLSIAIISTTATANVGRSVASVRKWRRVISAESFPARRGRSTSARCLEIRFAVVACIANISQIGTSILRIVQILSIGPSEATSRQKKVTFKKEERNEKLCCRRAAVREAILKLLGRKHDCVTFSAKLTENGCRGTRLAICALFYGLQCRCRFSTLSQRHDQSVPAKPSV